MGTIVTNIVLFSVLIYEIVGPFLTKISLEKAGEIDPEGKHIALGGDLDGCDELHAGFDGIQSYPDMADALLRRCVGEKIVRNIYWNNAMEVFRNAVPVL